MRTCLTCTLTSSVCWRRAVLLQSTFWWSCCDVSRVRWRAIDVSDRCSAKRVQLNADETGMRCSGPSAGVRQLGYHTEPERRQAVSGSPWLGRLVWYWAVFASSHLPHVTLSHTSSARSAPSSSSTFYYRDVTIRLVKTLMLSRRDYCNAVFADLPASTLASLQRVGANCSWHQVVTWPHNSCPAGVRQSWLPIAERIQYKLCLLVHKVLLLNI